MGRWDVGMLGVWDEGQDRVVEGGTFEVVRTLWRDLGALGVQAGWDTWTKIQGRIGGRDAERLG